MAFKGSQKEAPASTRTHQKDPLMVAEAEKLVNGTVKSVQCTGDEKLSIVIPKGDRQSPLEKSCRSEAGSITAYIKAQYKGTKPTRTTWSQTDKCVWVAMVTNGNGEAK